MCSHIDMQTHAGRLRLGFDFCPCPSDLKVSACRCPAVDYMSTDFGADSSSHFPFRAQRNRQTRLRTPIPTSAAIQPAWVIINFATTMQ